MNIRFKNLRLNLDEAATALFSLFSLLSLAACDSDLDGALRQAGDNRGEMEKVLEHFKNAPDGLGYEAAVFLIESMPYHNASMGEFADAFDSLCLRMAMEPSNDRTKLFNQRLAELTARRKRLDVALDITAVSADYLISMIEQACDTWRRCGWSDAYDKSIFFDYVLPYRLSNELLSDWHLGIDEKFPLLNGSCVMTRRGLQYEAEEAERVRCDATLSNGASQGKIVTLAHSESEVAFSVASKRQTRGRLIMKYATTASELTAVLKVNGTVADTLRPQRTRNMDTFAEKWFNVPFALHEGENIVAICNPSDTLGLDYIQIGVIEDFDEADLTDFSEDCYRICNKQTCRYITFDMERGNKTEGVELRPLSQDDKSQTLRLDYQGYPQWKICAFDRDSTDYCLEVKFGTAETLRPNSPVSQGASELRPFQNWVIFPDGDGCFRLMNRHTGMYLDTWRDEATGMERLVQNPYSGKDSQLWRFERAGKNVMRNTYYSIGSAISEAIRVWDVSHQFQFYAHNGEMSPRGYSLMKSKSGKCVDEANFTIYLCRHLGIPAAEDFTPHWGNRSQGHSWSVAIKPDGKAAPLYSGLAPGDTVHYFHPYKKPKVYRRRFSLNKEMASDMRREKDVPSLFKAPCYTDVTDEYYTTTDVTMDVPYGIASKHGVVYICVFDNSKWVPVHYGLIKDGKVTFTSMGRDIVYIAAAYDNRQVVPFGDPFLVKKDGSVQTFKADTKKTQTMRLVRKYPFMGAEDFFNFRMDGGQFQGANKADFSDAVTFHTHKGMTNGNWYDIPIDRNGTFRYLRYIGGKGSYCNINELAFYDENGCEIKGEIIGTEGESWARKEKVFDGDILTGFCANSPDGNWVGLRLNTPKRVTRLRYIPRNDGNCIEVGDEYALLCWMEGGWQEIAHQTASQNELNLLGMPTGGLYLLRDLTKGVEERIFSYEKGEQCWW